MAKLVAASFFIHIHRLSTAEGRFMGSTLDMRETGFCSSGVRVSQVRNLAGKIGRVIGTGFL